MPIRPAPIAAANPASKPVRGSVPEEAEAVPAVVALVALVVPAAVLDAVLDVGEDEDSDVVEVPLELLAVGVGAGAGELPVDVCELPDPFWLPCPASGSVYWLSPAEVAIAAAGTGRSTAASATSQVSLTRQERTPRVWQQSAGLTPAATEWSGSARLPRGPRTALKRSSANGPFAGFIATPGAEQAIPTGRVRVLRAPS